MEKFSKITGQSIPQEPISELSKEEKEYNELKMGILSLMDNFLTIRSYGNPRQELINNNIGIDGKEMFAEALIDLVIGQTKKDNLKVLESLKLESGDWFAIDKKISEIENEIIFEQKKENKTRKTNIRSFLKTYGNTGSFDLMVEKYCGRILNGKEAYERGLVCKSMIKKSNNPSINQNLSEMCKGLFRRSKQLGHV